MTTTNFELLTCSTCGIQYQVPEEFDDDRQNDGAAFYCPNGHQEEYVDCIHDTIEELANENIALKAQVRNLKCKLIGKVGMWDKIKMWWRGGLA